MKCKGVIIFLLIISMTASAATITYNQSAPATLGVDIAHGKRVFSPAQPQSGYTKADNITNETVEEWVTAECCPLDQLYAVIDLEETYNLGCFYLILNVPSKQSTGWSIWVSDDMVSWQNVFIQKANELPPETWRMQVDLEHVSGRYVKIQSDGGVRFGLQEIKIYGSRVNEITNISMIGESVSVAVDGNGIVFCTLVDEDNHVYGVYFEQTEQGTVCFKINKSTKAKFLKIHFLKDIETMEQFDSARISL